MGGAGANKSEAAKLQDPGTCWPRSREPLQGERGEKRRPLGSGHDSSGKAKAPSHLPLPASLLCPHNAVCLPGVVLFFQNSPVILTVPPARAECSSDHPATSQLSPSGRTGVYLPEQVCRAGGRLPWPESDTS